MKRKLFVFHTESIYSRGGEKYLFELLKRLAPRYQVIIYFQKISDDWEKRYRAYGIETRKFWQPWFFYWLFLPLTLVGNFLRLRSKIKKDDVIYATNFPVNLLAIFLSKKTICHCPEPLPIFYDPVRIQSLPPFSRLCVRVAKLWYGTLDQLAIRKSRFLVTLNPSVERHIGAVYGRKPDAYVPNGVDTAFFKPQGPRLLTKRAGKYLIGHSTDYTVFKGTQAFLRGLSLLKRATLRKIKAYISESMKDPAVKHEYRGFIREHHLDGLVVFVGNVTEKKLAAFYRSLDLFCYTGSPVCAGGSTASLSVLEAQACTTPVVRSVGNDDEIIDGKTGWYVDPQAPQTIARQIEAFLALSDQQRDQMGKTGRRYMRDRFSWSRSVQSLDKLIQQVARQ